ncbi:MAG TPA: hypothetical protein VFG50_05820 [Rhodothermales bacterium]|nr:hypothetical protein [Rhodothermales bacterium]
MLKHIPSAFFTLVMIAALSGCASLKLKAPPAVHDTNELMSYFDQKNLGYLYEGPTAAPHFSVPAQKFTVGNGAEMEVFEYTNSGAALLDVTWLDDFMNGNAAPHLYRGQDVVVIYYGNDPGVMNALSDVLGVPIA